MPVIWIPAQLRDLTKGKAQIAVPGSTLRQAIDALDACHPGIRAYLLDGDQLRKDFSVIVDGTVSTLKLRQPLLENTEVHILPAIKGG